MSRSGLSMRMWAAAIVLLVALVSVPARVGAEVTLPHVIGNHMVLQQGIPLRIWGWADPGEKVRVTIAGATKSATADADGEWMVALPAMEAGGPHEMVIAGANTITLTDILVGEVWICSGQSNMQWPIGQAEGGQEAIASADYPKIRLFDVPRRAAGQPKPDVNAQWRVCSPQTVAGFSAVGYLFGLELHTELDVPVGLIGDSWGGTRIEPWTPPEGFAGVPELAQVVERIKQANEQYRRETAASLDSLAVWIAETRRALDAGLDVPIRPDIPQHPLDGAGAATGLYNGMIHGLVPFAIRGAIWYQGEANVWDRDGMSYCDKMKALVGGWRHVWGEGDFPFYYVQLAPFRYRRWGNELPSDELPKLWEAQTAALEIPNTGMAVITDIGNVADIHPRNKKDVAHRLALWALAKTYGKETVYSGPIYNGMKVEDGTIRVEFEHTGSGLASRDGEPLTWFQIAGEDKQFVDAQARIDGKTVVVSSDDVPHPVAVRFGWHMTAEPNLMNTEGLPASPFRTDSW